MASAFSHIAVPIALGISAGRRWISGRLFALMLFLSVAPDLDSIAFQFGIPYESQWGHRGFTHSIFFAAFIALVFTRFFRFFKTTRLVTFTALFISMISHGILDALTTGGLGVAFFWPLNNERYFFPWQVIEVSPISVARFFTQKGLSVLSSEAYYIWLPCLVIALIFYFLRVKRTGQ